MLQLTAEATKTGYDLYVHCFCVNKPDFKKCQNNIVDIEDILLGSGAILLE